MKISVVVPCYNAEKTIERCLKSLVSVDYPKGKYEIIVVDDGSKDKTVGLAKKFRGVKVFSNKHAGPAVQRNFGARKAKGDVIMFTDSDCVVPRDILKRVENNFKEDIAGVGGVYKTLNKESITARYIGYEIEYRHVKSPRETNFLGTYCCAYKKDIFLKFKGFDESFPTASGEDPELSFRIADAGYGLVLDKKMFVWHPHPESLKKYLRQQFWRAYWRVLMYKKHPKKITGDPYSKGIPLMTMTFGFFCLSLLASMININILYLSAALLILFYALNAGFISFSTKQEKTMIIFSPVVIFFRMIVWTFGFIYGKMKI